MSCNDDENIMLRRPKYDKTRLCVKCKVNSGNLVIRHAVYCRSCFNPLFSTKFRKCLEIDHHHRRQKAFKWSKNVCIAYSGGLGSTVLLDFISNCYFPPQNSEARPEGGSEHPRYESAWNKGFVCYVEISAAFSEVNDSVEAARAVAKQYGAFEFVPIRLESAFDHEWWSQVCGQSPPKELCMDISSEDIPLHSSSAATPVERLRSFISSLPTQTSISTAVANLIRLLLLYTSRFYGCSHLLLGTSLTSLSVSLISGISQGSGFNIREETLETWIPPFEQETDKILINRPLRDITMKECALYAWWNGLKVLGRKKFVGGKQGIGALTRDFIISLERDYPSTVSTVARTCAKLAPKVGEESTLSLCILCERPAQPGISQHWKSRIAIRSFAELRRTTLAHSSAPASIMSYLLPDEGDADEEPVPDALEQSSALLAPHLCYACHSMLTSRSGRGVVVGISSTAVPLPVWTLAHLPS